MGEPHYGYSMDRAAPTAGSVKRARERMQSGYAPPPRRQQQPVTAGDCSPQGHLSPPPRRHMPPSQPPSQPPPPLPTSVASPTWRQRPQPALDGKGAHAISRPTQVPQWPLPPGSPMTLTASEPYQPPPGRPLRPPPRPARPSRIPSMVDQSRPQEPTPVFLNMQRSSDDIGESNPELNPSTPATPSSRLTTSSVGTIPEFPAPGTAAPVPAMPPRRSANLGPPPSSRRGASSFYSSTSYVSPIPEESARSHGSYASSAAMPETWSQSPTSPATSPNYGDAFYDDSVTERSHDSVAEDYGDESKLVRSASIGKKGKAALVDNKPAAAASQTRPSPNPVQVPFEGGTGYMDESTSSSNTVQTNVQVPVATPDATTPGATPGNGKQFLAPMGMDATAGSPGEGPTMTPQPPPSSRLSAIKRPPRLDMDAVRAAEARGSMSSLSDLIKRATRLATMIERGKRPASRFDNFNDLLEKAAAENKDDGSNDRHQSGLSDMLAAFPPPAQSTPNERQSRGSWFRSTSWPLAPGRRQGGGGRDVANSRGGGEKTSGDDKPRAARRCCGMPPWVFVIVVIVVLCAIAAAIVVPLQFFVFKNLGNHQGPQPSSDRCEEDLVCKNGGTNVVSKGVCSCICTNGFTGSDCGAGGSEGCTTTNLVSTDSSSNIKNVTLGQAIPRLIADANANFSIPLSGTAILAKINNGDISCREQNSLVTFDGRPTRMGEEKAEIVDDTGELGDAEINAAAFAPVKTITITPGIGTTITFPDGHQAVRPPTQSQDIQPTAEPLTTETPLVPRTTDSSSSNDNKPTAQSHNSPNGNFTVTEEVLDFSRVAVLYVLQEAGSNDAETAQTSLQRFFSSISGSDSSVTQKRARNVTVGGGNSVDLVEFQVDAGNGPIGHKAEKSSVFAT